MNLVQNKVVLVTGASRGIGKAIATSFAKAGAHVAFTYLSSVEKGEALEKELLSFGIKAKGYRSDASQYDESEELVEAVLADFQTIDILINNAGITKDGLVLRMSDGDFEDVINSNLTGAFRVARRATKGLLKLKRGRLIFIGSVVGGVGAAGQVNYAASKSGLLGMARSFARELGSRGITANVIAPGFVETDMTATLDEKRREEIAKSVPLGRFCTADEIADVVRFVASKEASYITGALIPVDGGLGMGH